MSKKTILLTGGGTGGHVIPALALVPELLKHDYAIHYMGSYEGIERDLVHHYKKEIPYYAIPSGKLRRYLSKENLTDMLQVIKGIKHARHHLGTIKPDVVFSKGGFVSVPVVIAAWQRRIPVVIHESDASMGLANKIGVQFARAMCTSFPELEHQKAFYTGTPLRENLLTGDAAKAKAWAGFDRDLPTLLMMGGSSGSVRLNAALAEALPYLLPYFNIIHVMGRGNLTDTSLTGYKQVAFIHQQLPDVFALADIVVSRAGANAVFEFLALGLPSLLIPLPLSASRGDQIDNAKSFEKRGYSKVLLEENLTREQLIADIRDLYKNRKIYAFNMKKAKKNTAVKDIVAVIVKHTKTKSVKPRLKIRFVKGTKEKQTEVNPDRTL